MSSDAETFSTEPTLILLSSDEEVESEAPTLVATSVPSMAMSTAVPPTIASQVSPADSRDPFWECEESVPSLHGDVKLTDSQELQQQAERDREARLEEQKMLRGRRIDIWRLSGVQWYVFVRRRRS